MIASPLIALLLFFSFISKAFFEESQKQTFSSIIPTQEREKIHLVSTESPVEHLKKNEEKENILEKNFNFSRTSNKRNLQLSSFTVEIIVQGNSNYYPTYVLSQYYYSYYDPTYLTVQYRLSGTTNSWTTTDIISNSITLPSADVYDVRIDSTTYLDTSEMFAGCYEILEVNFISVYGQPYQTRGMFESCYMLQSVNLGNIDFSYVEDTSYMFGGCESLRSITFGTNLNVTSLRYMYSMFYNCMSLSNVDFINSFNLTYVYDMSSVFSYCSNLTSVTINPSSKTTELNYINGMFQFCSNLTSVTFGNNFNTSYVIDMGYLFEGCSSLAFNSIHFGTGFTTSNVHYFDFMFAYNSFTAPPDISSFNMTSLTSIGGWFAYCTSLTSIAFPSYFPTENITNMGYLFEGCSNLTTISFPSGFTTAKVTSMYYMFYGCTSLRSITFPSGFTTVNVTSLGYMFYGCTSLTSISLTSFTTTKVTNLYYMFYKCSNLTSISFPSTFDTSKVNYFYYMFYGCTSLLSLTLPSAFNTSSATYMYYMFYGCSNLTSISFSSNFILTKYSNSLYYMFYGCTSLKTLSFPEGFDTTNVTSFQYMFGGCSNLTSISFPSTFVTSGKLTSISYMFYGCTSLKSISFPSGFSTANATSFAYMFYGCANLTSLALSASFSTQNATSLSYMFYGCKSLTNVDFVNDFDYTKVTTIDSMFRNCEGLTSIRMDAATETTQLTSMSYLFFGCTNLSSITIGSNFQTGKVTSMSYLFGYCQKLTSFDFLNYFNYTSVTSMQYMFEYNGFTSITFPNNFDAPKVTSMYGMFYSCPNLLSVTFNSQLNTSSLTNIQYMFYNCSSLTSISFIENLNITKVTSFSYLFGLCINLTSVTFLSSLNTSSLTSLNYMFYNCSSLTSINFNPNLIFSKVSSMGYLFYNCTNLQTVTFDFNANVSSLYYMYYMFYNCTNLESINFSSTWNSTSLSTLNYMFYNCTKLTDVSFLNDKLNTSKVTSMNSMFYNCKSLTSVVFDFDASSLQTMNYVFQNCSYLESVTFGDNFNTSKLTGMYYLFYGCIRLKNVYFGSTFNTTKVTSMSYMFQDCYSLCNLDLSKFTFNVIPTLFGTLDCSFMSITLPATYPSSLLTSNACINNRICEDGDTPYNLNGTCQSACDSNTFYHCYKCVEECPFVGQFGVCILECYHNFTTEESHPHFCDCKYALEKIDEEGEAEDENLQCIGACPFHHHPENKVCTFDQCIANVIDCISCQETNYNLCKECIPGKEVSEDNHCYTFYETVNCSNPDEHPAFNDSTQQCYNSTPEGYYLSSNDNIYYQCPEECAVCRENCLEIQESLSFEVPTTSDTETNEAANVFQTQATVENLVENLDSFVTASIALLEDDKVNIIQSDDFNFYFFSKDTPKEVQEQSKSPTVDIDKECEETINKAYNITEDNPICMGILESNKEGSEDKDVKFQFFDSKGNQINMSICTNIKLDVSKNAHVAGYGEDIIKISELLKAGVDLTAISEDNMDDICFSMEIDGKDTTAKIRQTFMESSNSICGKGCKLVNISTETNRVDCSCNSFEAFELGGMPQNQATQLLAQLLSSSNLLLFKCYDTALTPGKLLKNTYFLTNSALYVGSIALGIFYLARAAMIKTNLTRKLATVSYKSSPPVKRKEKRNMLYDYDDEGDSHAYNSHHHGNRRDNSSNFNNKSSSHRIYIERSNELQKNSSRQLTDGSIQRKCSFEQEENIASFHPSKVNNRKNSDYSESNTIMNTKKVLEIQRNLDNFLVKNYDLGIIREEHMVANIRRKKINPNDKVKAKIQKIGLYAAYLDDYEIMDFFDALNYDFRSFCEIYCDSLVKKAFFIQILFSKNEFLSLPLKFSLLFFTISCFYFVAAFFYTSSKIEKIFYGEDRIKLLLTENIELFAYCSLIMFVMSKTISMAIFSDHLSSMIFDLFKEIENIRLKSKLKYGNLIITTLEELKENVEATTEQDFKDSLIKINNFMFMMKSKKEIDGKKTDFFTKTQKVIDDTFFKVKAFFFAQAFAGIILVYFFMVFGNLFRHTFGILTIVVMINVVLFNVIYIMLILGITILRKLSFKYKLL